MSVVSHWFSCLICWLVGGECFNSSPFSGQCICGRKPLLVFTSLAKAASKCALESVGGQGAFLQGCFPAGHSSGALVPRVVPPRGQDFALPLGAILEIPLKPFLQPARIPLDGCTAFCCVSRSSQFGILRGLVRVRCVPSPRWFLRLFWGTGPTFDPCKEPAGWLQFFQIQQSSRSVEVQRGTGISALHCWQIAPSHFPGAGEVASWHSYNCIPNGYAC